MVCRRKEGGVVRVFREKNGGKPFLEKEIDVERGGGGFWMCGWCGEVEEREETP